MSDKTVMTCQEVFDKVATHLFAQGERATDKTNRFCVYRSANGNQCAVGCLIPDDEYDSAMEGHTISTLVSANRTTFSPTLSKMVWKSPSLMNLLTDLQNVHDDSYTWTSTIVIRTRMGQIGLKHRLDTSILETLSFKDR